jgi:probable phosphoglycerate mutase
MNLYVLRHGQTEMNSRDLVVGITDDKLTEAGIEQAKEAAKKIADFNGTDAVDIIICSPLIRAKVTAQTVQEAIQKKTGKKLDLIIDERLIEQNYGELEGTSRFSEEFAISRGAYACRTGKTGESILMLGQRAYNLIDEVKEKYAGKTVLFVTHGGICRVIRSYFYDMTPEEYPAWRALNCQLDKYTL